MVQGEIAGEPPASVCDQLITWMMVNEFHQGVERDRQVVERSRKLTRCLAVITVAFAMTYALALAQIPEPTDPSPTKVDDAGIPIVDMNFKFETSVNFQLICPLCRKWIRFKPSPRLSW